MKQIDDTPKNGPLSFRYAERCCADFRGAERLFPRQSAHGVRVSPDPRSIMSELKKRIPYHVTIWRKCYEELSPPLKSQHNFVSFCVFRGLKKNIQHPFPWRSQRLAVQSHPPQSIRNGTPTIRGELQSLHLAKVLPKLKVGDKVRFISLPEEWVEPGFKVMPECAKFMKAMIKRSFPSRVYKIDEYGQPWIQARLKVKDGYEWHTWAIFEKTGWRRVNRNAKRISESQISPNAHDPCGRQYLCLWLNSVP